MKNEVSKTKAFRQVLEKIFSLRSSHKSKIKGIEYYLVSLDYSKNTGSYDGAHSYMAQAINSYKYYNHLENIHGQKIFVISLDEKNHIKFMREINKFFKKDIQENFSNKNIKNTNFLKRFENKIIFKESLRD